MDAPIPRREVLFEGCREEEIPNLPKEMIEKLIALGQPLGFPAGSASAPLRNWWRTFGHRARADRGWQARECCYHLASLRRRYARLHGFSDVEWIVPAVSCAKPNPKLRRVLEGRGFIVSKWREWVKLTISWILCQTVSDAKWRPRLSPVYTQH